MVEIGHKYRVKPEFARSGAVAANVQKGTVVYIHPQGHYAVLEFEGVHGQPREAFGLALLTEENLVREKGRRA